MLVPKKNNYYIKIIDIKNKNVSNYSKNVWLA